MVLPRAAVSDALALIGRRLAAVFVLPWATITLGEAPGNARRLAIPLLVGDRRLVALVIPAGMREGVVTHQEGTRLGRLIDDWLDLSRLEAHAAVPRLAECSCVRSIAEAGCRMS